MSCRGTLVCRDVRTWHTRAGRRDARGGACTTALEQLAALWGIWRTQGPVVVPDPKPFIGSLLLVTDIAKNVVV